MAKIRELINVMHQAQHAEEPDAGYVIERSNQFEKGSLWDYKPLTHLMMVVVVKLLCKAP